MRSRSFEKLVASLKAVEHWAATLGIEAIRAKETEDAVGKLVNKHPDEFNDLLISAKRLMDAHTCPDDDLGDWDVDSHGRRFLDVSYGPGVLVRLIQPNEPPDRDGNSHYRRAVVGGK